MDPGEQVFNKKAVYIAYTNKQDSPAIKKILLENGAKKCWLKHQNFVSEFSTERKISESESLHFSRLRLRPKYCNSNQITTTIRTNNDLICTDFWEAENALNALKNDKSLKVKKANYALYKKKENKEQWENRHNEDRIQITTTETNEKEASIQRFMEFVDSVYEKNECKCNGKILPCDSFWEYVDTKNVEFFCETHSCSICAKEENIILINETSDCKVPYYICTGHDSSLPSKTACVPDRTSIQDCPQGGHITVIPLSKMNKLWLCLCVGDQQELFEKLHKEFAQECETASISTSINLNRMLAVKLVEDNSWHRAIECLHGNYALIDAGKICSDHEISLIHECPINYTKLPMFSFTLNINEDLTFEKGKEINLRIMHKDGITTYILYNPEKNPNSQNHSIETVVVGSLNIWNPLKNCPDDYNERYSAPKKENEKSSTANKEEETSSICKEERENSSISKEEKKNSLTTKEERENSAATKEEGKNSLATKERENSSTCKEEMENSSIPKEETNNSSTIKKEWENSLTAKKEQQNSLTSNKEDNSSTHKEENEYLTTIEERGNSFTTKKDYYNGGDDIFKEVSINSGENVYLLEYTNGKRAFVISKKNWRKYIMQIVNQSIEWKKAEFFRESPRPKEVVLYEAKKDEYHRAFVVENLTNDESSLINLETGCKIRLSYKKMKKVEEEIAQRPILVTKISLKRVNSETPNEAIKGFVSKIIEDETILLCKFQGDNHWETDVELIDAINKNTLNDIINMMQTFLKKK